MADQTPGAGTPIGPGANRNSRQTDSWCSAVEQLERSMERSERSWTLLSGHFGLPRVTDEEVDAEMERQDRLYESSPEHRARAHRWWANVCAKQQADRGGVRPADF
jgi:hypothetical protein